MNKNVTSKAELISTALDIAREEGVHKVSIRNIAQRCSISVGVLYNYFPTKADLIFAVVTHFWENVSEKLEDMNGKEYCFTEYIAQFFHLLDISLSDFQREWLTQMETMAPEDKARGKEMELQCFRHLKSLLLQILSADTSISASVWTDSYTREEFIEFVFWHMVQMLRSGQKDCSFFMKTLQRILY
jgi:AcrR family transcriptional regulator